MTNRSKIIKKVKFTEGTFDKNHYLGLEITRVGVSVFFTAVIRVKIYLLTYLHRL